MCSNAQQIDKKLLIGRWVPYYWIEAGGINVCRDSIAEIEAKRALWQLLYRERESIYNDSMKGDLTQILDIKQTTIGLLYQDISYDERGHVTIEAVDKKNDRVRSPLRTGTYKWIGKNKIREKFGKYPAAQFTVVVLTESRLTLKLGENMLRTFTRAK